MGTEEARDAKVEKNGLPLRVYLPKGAQQRGIVEIKYDYIITLFSNEINQCHLT